MALTIFLTGATGYIGGQVLSELLASRKSQYKVTALVRGEERAAKLRDLGVETIIGSLDDTNLLSKASSQANIVIHTADADHPGSATAIVNGLLQTAYASERKIFIHTSGTGGISDNAKGAYTSDKIYSDLNVDDIKALPDKAIHRNVDLIVSAVGADPSNYITTAIIMPPTIYGIGAGPFNKLSIQIPEVIRFGIQHRKIYIPFEGIKRQEIQKRKIGIQHRKIYIPFEGENIWSSIHIKDLGRAYIHLLDKLIENKEYPALGMKGYDGYYFAENGEFQWRQIFEKVAQLLHKKGLVDDENVQSITFEQQVETLFNGICNGLPGQAVYLLWGSNSRSKAERLRMLGWKPTEKESVFDTIADETDAIRNKIQA
ncbi:unnamed protein product [Didymodactylos carnosus]|uniref:NAD(P)-binding domain-containing protein n=1 Tax=Didymodactylos carnosus TaxID=1234261 RepID=A0A815TD59_9BILA|nr:unnamed protein product [Didymodactylos carnosus]CAF4365112.1 unnamed protein product [Didymodactylos carnosus]